ncbi:MAG: NUDIX domain-containing protein [Bacteroidetes bacterium]|nr:NUDIX domain-containing protein [Bacteroidota bacterium]
MRAIIPNLSVDCVVFGFDYKRLNVLLTKRELKDPETGQILFTDYTVQGHHMLEKENIDEAAIRVLKDKTGLNNIYLEQFYAFGETDRMLKERDQLWTKKAYPMVSDHVISIGYYSLVDSSKVNPDTQHQETQWFPVDELPELGFDHEKIIQKALSCLRIKLSREPIGFELLPEKFTLTQMQTLYEVVLGTKFDRRNFRKKVTQMKYVIPLDEKQKGGTHKSAQVFIFSRDVYERTKKEKLGFTI